MAVFSSDALSSVSYATEEVLLVLMLAGGLALGYSIPISIAIIGLLFIVVFSYRQTIYEYPSGGGAYIVAHQNLGEIPGLMAGAALLIDYVLTVAVSVAAGVAAITSAFPDLHASNVVLCFIAIGLVVVMNLRGIRESAGIFSIPTYAFILGVLVMLATGFYMLKAGSFTHLDPPALEVQQPLTLLLLLRAFSSGCTAMTGVEAVSNGVPVFKHPESRNAAMTLIVMACILATMFFGISYLAHYHGIAPHPHETVVSQLARSIFGTSLPYYFIQFNTMGILILAANTAFTGFPRLASLLAKDRYLPRQLATLGDRLVFSNGIIILGLVSALMIVIFNANTHALIPLYAVGVFLSFTLSQFGMLRHWIKQREKGWLKHALLSGFGGTITAVITMIFTVTKFTHGAWVIIILIPMFVYMFLAIRHHYVSVGRQLSLLGADPAHFSSIPKHTVLLPISGVHKGVVEALKYAQSIAADVRAVYVEIDQATTVRLQEEWQRWGRGVPLVVLKSPYRSIMSPFLRYVDEVEESAHNDILTIIIPEFVTAKWWQQLLHNQTALLIRAALVFRRGKVVTSVRYHLN
ncbi:MAG: APC family permease [Bdellovibrionota bacterium]